MNCKNTKKKKLHWTLRAVAIVFAVLVLSQAVVNLTPAIRVTAFDDSNSEFESDDGGETHLDSETHTVRFFAEWDDSDPESNEPVEVFEVADGVTVQKPDSLGLPEGMSAFVGWYDQPQDVNPNPEKSLAFPQTITCDTDFFAGWSDGKSTSEGLPAVKFANFSAASAAVDITTWISWTISGGEATITSFDYLGGLSPTKIVIPAELEGCPVTAINDNVFSGCQLTSVEFDEESTLRSIGNGAFQNNPIESIKLPETVTSLGPSAFQSCNKLEFIDLSELTGLTTIPTSCFNSCSSLVTAELPPNLAVIDYNAFYSCTSLDYIKIPPMVAFIGDDAFYNIKEDSVIDCTYFQPGDIAKAPWNAWTSYIRWAPEGDDNDSIFVFNKDTGMICGIKEEYKTHANASMNITIPDSINGTPVLGLSDGAFGSRPANQKIKTADFEAGIPMTSIPTQAFAQCSWLTSVTNLPDTIISIDNKFAFMGCNQLTAIHLPDSITYIGVHSFIYCSSLSSVIWPADLITIDVAAFEWCSSLTSVTLPAKVTTVGDYAFQACGNLETVVFEGDEISFIGLYTFASDPKLTHIYIEQKYKGSVADAPWSAGNAAVHWKDVTDLPAEIIDDTGLWRFNWVTGSIMAYLGNAVGGEHSVGPELDLVVPSTLYYGGDSYNITEIGYDSTSAPGIIPAPKQLKSLTISDGIEIIYPSSFKDVKIETLDLGATVTTIYYNAFSNCGLDSIDLPDSLLSIGDSAFEKNNLTELTIPGNLTDIAINAFKDNSGITNILVKMYRHTASDPGAYNDEEELYRLAGTSISDRQPWGAPGSAEVLYMDDPRPVYSYVIVTDPEDNTAKVILDVYIKNEPNKIQNIQPDTGMPDITYKYISTNGVYKSTVEMVIISERGNGDYSFLTTYVDNLRTHKYTVPVDVFHGITFDPNGGTGTAPTDSDVYVPEYNYILPGDNGLTKEGAVFLGWSTVKSGLVTTQEEEDELHISDTYIFESEDAILYAVWAIDTKDPAGIPDYCDVITIHYEGKGGKTGTEAASVSETIAYDPDFELIDQPFTRAGYVFMGWATSSGATTEAYLNKSKAVEWIDEVEWETSEEGEGRTGEITFYAIWAAEGVSYKIRHIDVITGEEISDPYINTTTGRHGDVIEADYVTEFNTGYDYDPCDAEGNLLNAAQIAEGISSTLDSEGPNPNVITLYYLRVIPVTFDATYGVFDEFVDAGLFQLHHVVCHYFHDRIIDDEASYEESHLIAPGEGKFAHWTLSPGTKAKYTFQHEKSYGFYVTEPVTFYAVWEIGYTVKYVEKSTDEVIKAELGVGYVGSPVEVTAVVPAGYVLVSGARKTGKINSLSEFEKDNVIIFEVQKNTTAPNNPANPTNPAKNAGGGIGRNNIPYTGDGFYDILWFSAMIICAMGSAIIMILSRKCIKKTL